MAVYKCCWVLVLLNLLVTAGNLSPIKFFDHSSNTKLNGSMDTLGSTEELKEKQGIFVPQAEK